MHTLETIALTTALCLGMYTIGRTADQGVRWLFDRLFDAVLPKPPEDPRDRP